jgi:hypothetical protein
MAHAHTRHSRVMGAEGEDNLTRVARITAVDVAVRGAARHAHDTTLSYHTTKATTLPKLPHYQSYHTTKATYPARKHAAS